MTTRNVRRILLGILSDAGFCQRRSSLRVSLNAESDFDGKYKERWDVHFTLEQPAPEGVEEYRLEKKWDWLRCEAKSFEQLQQRFEGVCRAAAHSGEPESADELELSACGAD